MSSELKKNPGARAAAESGRDGPGWVKFDLSVEDRRELRDLVHDRGSREMIERFWRELGDRMGFVPSTVRNARDDLGSIVSFEAQRSDVVPERDDSAAIAWIDETVARLPVKGIDERLPNESEDGDLFFRDFVIDAWHAGRESAIRDWGDGVPLESFDVTKPPNLDRDAALAELVLSRYRMGHPLTKGDAGKVVALIERLRKVAAATIGGANFFVIEMVRLTPDGPVLIRQPIAEYPEWALPLLEGSAWAIVRSESPPSDGDRQ